MKKVICLLFISTSIFAQNHNHSFNRKIIFPDVEGFYSLKTDLHIHTVFSDGSVWPDIRVTEAVKDGLDVISLTEHLEYQPHKTDIPHPNRNRSFELASKIAENRNLMVVHGSEITRNMPPGHSNAIFITDANKILKDNAIEAFQEANRQGAFVFWNHPTWTGQEKDGIAKLYDLHKKLIKDGLMHGIEVVNEKSYSDEALQIALDNDLTILGTSDIHGLIDWDFEPEHGGHRPITLVFAKEKTQESLKEALFAGRTVVWYNEVLVGKEENVNLLLNASLKVVKANYTSDQSVLNITIKNHSDASMVLRNKSNYTFYANTDLVTVPGLSEIVLQVKTKQRVDAVDLNFEVMNAIIAPNTHPELVITAKVNN